MADPQTDPSTLEDIVSSPWAQLGIPALAGVISGFKPGVGRGIFAGASTLGVLNRIQATQRQQRLQDALQKQRNTLGDKFTALGQPPQSILTPPQDQPSAAQPLPEDTSFKSNEPAMNPRLADLLGQSVREGKTEQAMAALKPRTFANSKLGINQVDPMTNQVTNLVPAPEATPAAGAAKAKVQSILTAKIEQGIPLTEADKMNAKVYGINLTGGEEKSVPEPTHDALFQLRAQIQSTNTVPPRAIQAGYSKDPATALKQINDAIQGKAAEGLAEAKAKSVNVTIPQAIAEANQKPAKPGTYLDKEGNAISTAGLSQADADKLQHLDTAQEKQWGGLSTMLTHVQVTDELLNEIGKDQLGKGVRLNQLGKAKLAEFKNSPQYVALFQQLGQMTSFATAGALSTSMGGRGGVRMAEQLRPAGITEGDDWDTAKKKLQIWMKVASSNSKAAGLPTKPFDDTLKSIKISVNRKADEPKKAPADRFKELIGQGLDKAGAFKKMHEEGY